MTDFYKKYGIDENYLDERKFHEIIKKIIPYCIPWTAEDRTGWYDKKIEDRLLKLDESKKPTDEVRELYEEYKKYSININRTREITGEFIRYM